MVATKADRIRNQIKVYKGQIDRIYTWLDASGATATCYQVDAHMTRLDKINDNFEDSQRQLEEEDENELKSNTRAMFEKLVSDTMAALMELRQKIILNTSVAPVQNSVHDTSIEFVSGPPLPAIEIPKFSGNYQEYPNFQATFDSLVHENKARGMDDLRRFAILKSSLTGKAADAVKHLLVTADNYEVARKIIDDRFNKRRLIFDSLISTLFNATQARNVSDLRGISDLFDSQWKALGILTSSEYHLGEGVLIHLALRKCDLETQRRWDEKQMGSNEIPTWTEFSSFLQTRCTMLEGQSYSRQNFSNPPQQATRFQRPLPNKVVNAAHSQPTQCPSCNGSCDSVVNCDKFNDSSVEDRFLLCRIEKLCVKCLQPRPHYNCTNEVCNTCERGHNTLLHFDSMDQLRTAWDKALSLSKPTHSNVTTVEPAPMTTIDDLMMEEMSVLQTQVSNDKFSDSYTWLATALVCVADANGTPIVMRALLDGGSQISIISARALKLLGLKPRDTNLRVIGVNGDASPVNKAADLSVASQSTSFRCNITAAVHNTMHQRHPTRFTSITEWELPKAVKLADPEFNKPRSIDLLLGADIFYKILMGKNIILSNGRPDLILTQFGWVVAGPMTIPSSVNSCTLTLFSASTENNYHPMELEWMKKCWEVNAGEEAMRISPEEKACVEFFHATTKFENGRYTVKLPFKKPVTHLGQSREAALSRLYGNERKMERDDEYKKRYVDFMTEYETLGHMEEIPTPNQTEPHYYIPHFGVWNLDSTTTVFRTVFDASCATTTGHSLNDLLMVGPTVQPDVLTHLLRMRLDEYILGGDITKMYRQVDVDKDDRVFLLILWRKPGDTKIRTYALKTVTYGTASAPYQSVACLIDLSTRFKDKYPIGADAVTNCMYVDDLLVGSNEIHRLVDTYTQVKALLALGGFTIRKFYSNSSQVMSQIPEAERGTKIRIGESDVIKTLGMNWDPEADEFTFYFEQSEMQTVSKRTVLSQASRLFDPLGLLQPVTVRAKMFIQRLWADKSHWDEPLPESLAKEWSQIYNDLKTVDEIHILRYVMVRSDVADMQIHGFSDASTKAYAAALYIRCRHADDSITVQLLCAKTRLAPLKTQTIARLELCGALLLAELYAAVTKRVKLPVSATHLWTDSDITLKWITTSPHLRETFVANRVTKIQDLTAGCFWHHCPGVLNPSDKPSRGESVAQLLANRDWFSGPAFLYQDKSAWPPMPELPEAVPDTKNEVVVAVCETEPDVVSKVKFESWSRQRRTFAYVARFLLKLSSKLRPTHSLVKFMSKLPIANEPDQATIIRCSLKSSKLNTHLDVAVSSVAELRSGETIAVKIVQINSFPREIHILNREKLLPPHHHLSGLSPFIDDLGLIRVGGRLRNSADLTFSEKHPLLLPAKHKFTESLFKWTHVKLLHGGPKAMMAAVQRRYWVPRGKVVANQTFFDCNTCFKAKPTAYQQIMGQLPKDRSSSSSRPFTVTGVDFCGPFIVHNKGRGSRPTTMYLAVFVCFNSKAIHLELVEDLTTAAFLNTLQRFISRRGAPHTIWSDNATNFLGASRKLEDLKQLFKQNQHWVEVFGWCRDQVGTIWKFIPPRSPHFGGLWEAGVKSAKYHLVRAASSGPLHRDELDTLIASVEAILNNRPLIPLSTNPNDEAPITPAHFLVGSPLDQIPEPNLVDEDPSRLKQYQRVIAMKQQFWKRWSREYLSSLQVKYKWKQDESDAPQVGDVVLLIQRNVPSKQWQLGRIVTLFPGRDNKIRVAEVKTTTGTYKRSITELCPLPSNKKEKQDQIEQLAQSGPGCSN